MIKKFHFLSVNSSFSHSSLALPILHAAAKNIQNWQWTQTECTILSDPATVAIELAAADPDVIGCTLYLFNRNHALDILSRFHRLKPETKIVLGGPECTHESGRELLHNYPFIHTVFIGEAEGIFAEYLANFSDSMPRGILPENTRAQYDDWSNNQVINDVFFNTSKAFVQYETSRGCPIGCKYCTSSNIPLRLKDLRIIEKELEILQAKGVKEIRLLDRTFNFPQWRGAALLRLFREKFPGMEFHLEIHPQFLNNKIRKELSCAPNLHIEAGIQSLDEKVQHAIGRNSKSNEVINGIKFLASCTNFETHVDLICGLPEQDLNSLLNDIACLIQLNVDEIQLETLKILHGTPLQSLTENYSIAYSPTPPYDVMRTNTFAAEEILYTRGISRLLDLFHNHPSLRNIVRALELNTAEKLKIFTDFMLAANIGILSTLDLKKRVLLLADFVKKHPSDKAAFEISGTWLKQGYPMNELPFGEIRKYSGEPPSQADKKMLEILNHRETKLWQLICGSSILNFAVNRHFKLNGAALFWQ